LVKLQKFESLGGCIAKIEALDVELKIAPNFGVKCVGNKFTSRAHLIMGPRAGELSYKNIN
jgi:hypothetical protein